RGGPAPFFGIPPFLLKKNGEGPRFQRWVDKIMAIEIRTRKADEGVASFQASGVGRNRLHGEGGIPFEEIPLRGIGYFFHGKVHLPVDAFSFRSSKASFATSRS